VNPMEETIMRKAIINAEIRYAGFNDFIS